MKGESPAFHFHRATPRGEGGVALFEIYGSGALPAVKAAFRPRSGGLPEEGRARLADVVDPSGEAVDEAVLARVPAEAMWSRLPAWTACVHGGPWLEGRIQSILSGLGGGPLDTAGVLRHSMSAGAMDALEAAAYECLIAARTEKAARYFLRQHHGELSARLRAGIALADAGDARGAFSILESLLGAATPAYRLGHPLHVLLAGRPNAGKSTLFNRLLEEERAVVSPIPGTTRDTLEEMIAIGGFPIVIADGAGLRPLEAADPVEREGILRVHARNDDAVLHLVPYPWSILDEDRAFLARLEPERVLLIGSFADLARPDEEARVGLRISALAGGGLPALRRAIVERWIDGRDPPGQEVPAAPFTWRQRQVLDRAAPLPGHGRGPPLLDEVRRAYIECLRNSWP